MKRSARYPALLAVPFLLAFLGPVGCVNPSTGDTTGTTLFVYDDAAHQVYAWNDVNTIYNLAPGSTTAGAPDRTISSTLFTSMGPLAWGGMAASPSTNELYLVSENGTVVRVERASTQNGTLTNATDIATFTLGNPSADRLASSLFTQCAVDPSSGTLFATETGSNGAWRVWVVPSPNLIMANGQSLGGTAAVYIQSAALLADYGAFGLANAGSGNAFLFLTGGETVLDGLGGQWTGPRLRLTTGTAVNAFTNVLVGPAVQLWDQTNTPAFGTLAYDTTFNRLYLARPISNGDAPVVVFNPSQFTGGSLDQAPAASLADTASSLAALRFISHAGSKDWMVGADQPAAATDAGGATIHLWKGPSQGTASLAFTLPSAASSVKGAALTPAQ
jgi:hypothetical protein